MSDDNKDKVKVRKCGVENCSVRMSAIEKDRHTICPSHVGWQCTWDKRCVECSNWPDSQMRDYVRLTDGKARKKAYKDKVRAAKLAAGEHSLVIAIFVIVCSKCYG